MLTGNDLLKTVQNLCSMAEQPTTPPPELLQQLKRNTYPWLEQIGIAYRAGADQELEACCHEVQDMYSGGSRLRAARRPKPPSLKKQALALLDMAEDPSWDINDFSIVRQALEALPND
jgi:hypothetical protein